MVLFIEVFQLINAEEMIESKYHFVTPDKIWIPSKDDQWLLTSHKGKQPNIMHHFTEVHIFMYEGLVQNK